MIKEQIASILLDAPPILFREMVKQDMTIEILSARYPHSCLATMSVSESSLNKIEFTYFKGYPLLELPNIKNDSKFILDSVLLHLSYLDFEPETYFAEVRVPHIGSNTKLRCVFRNNPRRS